MTPAMRAALAACAAFCVAVFLGLSLRDDLPRHGDVATDNRAIVGAHAFERSGLGALQYTQAVDDGVEVGLTPKYYFRHPSAGVVALTLLRRAGLTLTQARFLPLLCTTLGILGVFLMARAVTGRPWFALTAMVLYASLAPVWLLADSYQFYSYAIGVKGIALWLVASGVNHEGGARRLRFALAGAVAFVGAVACGLETLPATGLASFFVPLFLGRGAWGARARAAAHAAAWVGAGMALGVVVHVAHMVSLKTLDWQAVYDNLTTSLRSRTQGGQISAMEGRGLPMELAYRFADYAPIALGLAALGLLAAPFRRAAGAVASARPGALALALVMLLSEGLYFVVMRGHVFLHVHTAVHLCVALACLAAWGMETVAAAARLPANLIIRGALVVVVAVTTAVVTPLRSYGNLTLPNPTDGEAMVGVSFAVFQRYLPPDAIVATSITGDTTWLWAYHLVMADLTFVDTAVAGVGRSDDAVFTLGKTTKRPVFAITSPLTPKSVAEALPLVARRVAGDAGHTLYAMANCDALPLPPNGQMIPISALCAGTPISPEPAALAAAKLGYPLVGRRADGPWLHAPPPGMSVPNTVRISGAALPRRTDFTRATATWRYDRHATMDQPDVIVELALSGAESAPASGSAPAGALRLRPGETGTCGIRVPDGHPPEAFTLSVRVADGFKYNTACGVVCTRVFFECK